MQLLLFLGFGRALALGIFLAGLRSLGAVFRAAATASIHPKAVESSPDDVIAHAGEIFDAASADEDDRVFLKVVPLARDVSDHFLAVRQAHLGDFAKRGVRLFRRAGHHLHTNAAALRAVHQSGRFRFDRDLAASFADQLVDCGHWVILFVGPPDSMRQ